MNVLFTYIFRWVKYFFNHFKLVSEVLLLSLWKTIIVENAHSLFKVSLVSASTCFEGIKSSADKISRSTLIIDTQSGRFECTVSWGLWSIDIVLTIDLIKGGLFHTSAHTTISWPECIISGSKWLCFGLTNSSNV